jgi:hypothetical protein
MGKKDKNNGTDGLPGSEATTVKKPKGALADPSSGDQFKMADNLGALILVEAKEFESGFVTENGPADIIRGDVTVLTEDDGKTPLDEAVEYRDTIIFGRAVIGSLKSAVGSGSLIVGTIGQGEKKAGKNAPWLLKPASDKQKKIAENFLA